MPKSTSQIALSRKQSDPVRAAVRAAIRDEDTEKTALAAARAALDKKAEDVTVIDLRGVSGYADFLVIGSGTSDRHLETVADGVEKALHEQGRRPIGSEGHRGGHWVLLDFGDVVVHVFHAEERAHYDLEGLWADAPRVEVQA